MGYAVSSIPMFAAWIGERVGRSTNQFYATNGNSDGIGAVGGPEINFPSLGFTNLRIGGGTVGATEDDRAWGVLRPQDGDRDFFGGSQLSPAGTTYFNAILQMTALSADTNGIDNWGAHVIGDNVVAGNNWPANWVEGDVHWGSIADNADTPCLHNGGSSARGSIAGTVFGTSPSPAVWNSGAVITWGMSSYWQNRFLSADNNGFVLRNNLDNNYTKWSSAVSFEVHYGNNLTGLGGTSGSERIDASWNNVGADSYSVYLDGVFQGTTGGFSWHFGGLNPGQVYNVQVYPNYSPYGTAGGQGFNLATVALVAISQDHDFNADITKAIGPLDHDTNFDITKAIGPLDHDTDFDIFVAIDQSHDTNLDLTRSRGPIDFDTSIFIGEVAETKTFSVFGPVEGAMIELIGASRVLTFASDDNGVTWVDATLITQKPLTHETLGSNILANGDFNVSLTPRYVNGPWAWQTTEQFSAGGAVRYTAPSNAAPAIGNAELINTYTVPSDSVLQGGTYRASVWGKYDTTTDQVFSAGSSFLEIRYRDGTNDTQEIVNWATDLQPFWNRYSGVLTADSTKEIDQIRLYHLVEGQSPCLYDPYNNPTLFAYFDVEVVQVDVRDDDADFRAVQFPAPGNDLKLRFLLYDLDSALSGYRLTPLYVNR